MPRDTYIWLGVDTIIRIAGSMLFLFVLVPRLAMPRRPGTTALERFWWSFAVGTLALTLIGELLSFGNLYTLPTLLLAIVLLIITARCVVNRERPVHLLRRYFEVTVIAVFNALDGRINFGRRFRLALRRAKRRLGERVSAPNAALVIAGWLALTVIAAGLRFYRPFSSLDFGASDPYVHLYWLKLLELGKQVDPAWGPYPRGLHFVLLAVVKLANVDEVLLMNFFGAFIGVLITLSVADVIRRISGSVRAGLLAGLLFATMVGGPGQFWIIGGRFDGNEVPRLPHAALTYFGHTFVFITKPLIKASFDLLFWAFKRQTVTLPQEMAVVLLFPAALFALDYFRKRDSWHLIGFGAAVAAIASTHPGVLLPLLLIIIAAVIAYSITAHTMRIGKAFWLTTLGAALIGFSWALVFAISTPGKGFLSYYTGKKDLSYFVPVLSSTSTTALPPLFTSTTPLMIIVGVLSLITLAAAFLLRDADRATRLKFVAIAALLFIAVQISSSLSLPMILDPTRNCVWLIMAVAGILAIAANAIMTRLEHVRAVQIVRVPAAAAVLLALFLWVSRVPDLQAEETRGNAFVDATEYGIAAEALLGIERRLKPFTWTIVTYGQEYPHVLGRGYHMASAEFLERYAPNDAQLMIPTPYVFIVVEKTPHPFEVHAWDEFSRSNLEERLQAWCVLYQAQHDNMRVYIDTDQIRVYVVQRSEQEANQIARRST